MTLRAERDPFGSTTDPRAYVPRPACEAALAELLATLRGGGQRLALTGPNGIGKTQLLRVLEERLGDEAEVLILPYAGVEFEDLCRWILGTWGRWDKQDADEEALAASLLDAIRAHASDGRMLLLALDDASGMPLATARQIGALIDRADGALRVLIVPVDDPRAGRLLAAFGPELDTVRFSTPMTEDETTRYVASRIAWAAPGAEIADRFDEGTVRWLHRASGGMPRELHRLALQVQRGIGREAAQADSDVPWLDVEPEVLDATRRGAGESIAPALVLDDEPLLPRESASRGIPRSAEPGDSSLADSAHRAEAPRRGAWTWVALAGGLLAAGWAWSALEVDPAGAPPGSEVSRDGPSELEGTAIPAREPGEENAAPESLVEDTLAAVRPRREAVDRDPFRVPPEAAPAEGPGEDPEARLVEVSVNAVPWATVVIDGIERGTTPLAGIELTEGVHRFRLEHADGHVREADRHVSPQNRAFAFGQRTPATESTGDPEAATSPRIGP